MFNEDLNTFLKKILDRPNYYLVIKNIPKTKNYNKYIKIIIIK